MKLRLRTPILEAALGAGARFAPAADAPAAATPLPPQMIALQVSVDAAGKVASI